MQDIERGVEIIRKIYVAYEMLGLGDLDMRFHRFLKFGVFLMTVVTVCGG